MIFLFKSFCVDFVDCALLWNQYRFLLLGVMLLVLSFIMLFPSIRLQIALGWCFSYCFSKTRSLLLFAEHAFIFIPNFLIPVFDTPATTYHFQRWRFFKHCYERQIPIYQVHDLRQVLSTVAKIKLVVPVSHFRVAGFEFQLHSSSSLLLMQSRSRSTSWVSCHPHGRPDWIPISCLSLGLA